MKYLFLLPLILFVAVSQAQDTSLSEAGPPGNGAAADSSAPTTGQTGVGTPTAEPQVAVPLGPGIPRPAPGVIPVASVDQSDAPEFRGTQPGQPRRVFHLVLSQWQTNCYVLVGPHNQAIVIDPTDWLTPLPDNHWDVGDKDNTGHNIQALIDLIRKERLTVRYVVSTHGHLDHVSGWRALKNAFHCLTCIHAADTDAEGRPKDSHMFPGGLPKMDLPLPGGGVLLCDGIKLKIIHTPGHSPGSISLVCGNWVFSGDTLFYRTVGRTNFVDGSGNWAQEISSIRTRLYTLPPATLVLPGHSAFTTIGDEKANNPWTTEVPLDTTP